MVSLGPEFRHDVFVSYSQGDVDQSGTSHLKTWSLAFARELEAELRTTPDLHSATVFVDQSPHPDHGRLTKKEWEDAEEVSMYRGLAAMRARLPVPLWTIQLAGQDVETWSPMGEFPIFTEHTDAQFGWMKQSSFDRQDVQPSYAERSKMILAPALDARCRGRSG
jgi:hypothetical protein